MADKSANKVPFPLEKGQYLYSPVAAAEGRSDEEIVRDVQRALGVEETGVYDTATREAVYKVQKKRRLPLTAAVDEATWKVLPL